MKDRSAQEFVVKDVTDLFTDIFSFAAENHDLCLSHLSRIQDLQEKLCILFGIERQGHLLKNGEIQVAVWKDYVFEDDSKSFKNMKANEKINKDNKGE